MDVLKQAEDEALELLERVPAEETPEDDTEPEAETPETEPDSELAAYRRAALTEQNAAARARRLQAHVSALCDNARSRYQDTGEEISALSVDLTTGKTFYLKCALTERSYGILRAGGLLNYTREVK